jgi:putative ATPase
VDLSPLSEDVRRRLVEAEEAIYTDPADPMVNWDVADLESALHAAGLSDVHSHEETQIARQPIGPEQLSRWFGESSDRGRPTYAMHLRRTLSPKELAGVQALFERQLPGQAVDWTAKVVYLSARQRGS